MTASAHTPELDRLLNASVDGELSELDEAAFQRLLRDDPAARRRYLQFMQLHAELHWDHGASAALLAGPENCVNEVGRAGQRAATHGGGWLLPAIAAGSIATGVLLALVHFTTRDAGPAANRTAPVIANMEMKQGTVAFRTADGEAFVLPDEGHPLTSGTLVVEGESSVAQWRFLDGSQITVSGDAEISISAPGQKRLRLRRGLLTAEVKPQPGGAPLVVETPTARVEVLGTVFTLAAEPEQTRINVTQGRVRLKRLVDGETVEVSQQHSCVAALDASGKLRPEVPDDPTNGWLHRFAAPPPAQWKGEWRPAVGDLPARVRAVACLVGRKREADDTPIVHYGITARRVAGVSLGTLPADAVLRVRFRTDQPARLQLMLGLNRADGRFGGNFEIKLPRDSGTLQAGGWRELSVPLADFRPLVPRHPQIEADARPYLLLLTTYNENAGLEVSELAIQNVKSSK